MNNRILLICLILVFCSCWPIMRTINVDCFLDCNTCAYYEMIKRNYSSFKVLEENDSKCKIRLYRFKNKDKRYLENKNNILDSIDIIAKNNLE